MEPGRALVVGAGSMGLRHAAILRTAGRTVDVVSRRDGVEGPGGDTAIPTLVEGLRRHPELVILAREATMRGGDLRVLAEEGFAGVVVAEKPLTASPEPVPVLSARAAAVGYQLRFHPCVAAIRSRLAGAPPLLVSASVGQHLDGWRPDRPLAATVSGDAGRGGGVLRELSHELDLALHLAGPWRRVLAAGGSTGALPVPVDDHWTIVIEHVSGCVSTVELDGLDRGGRRTLRVVTEDRTWDADLLGGRLREDGGVILDAPVDRDALHAAVHADAIAGGRLGCTLDEGAEVVRLIAAIESAAGSGMWVVR